MVQYITDAPGSDKVKKFTITLQSLYNDNLSVFKSSEIASSLRKCAVSLSIELSGKKPQIRSNNIILIQSEPPGQLNERGARHDNDFEDYRKIKIIPTQSEILSKRDSFLPRDFTTSEFIPEITDRYLDQQFRLNREDGLHGIKKAISYFIDEGFAQLQERQTSIKFSDQRDQMTIMTYRNVVVETMEPSWHNGIVCNLTFEQFSNLKNIEERKMYWKTAGGSKLLQQGALVCLILESTNDQGKCNAKSILLATVVNSRTTNKEIRGSFYSPYCKVQLKLIENDALSDILSHLRRHIDTRMKNESILLEVRGHFFTTLEVILESLKNHNRATIPFQETIIESPMPFEETTVPLFLRSKKFNFKCIKKSTSDRKIKTEIQSYKDLKAILLEQQEHITLDASQIDAFVAGLTQQIPLIQGPPGTGKTYVGVQIVRFLLDNFSDHREDFFRFDRIRSHRILPILCVCYTNHALDQFLLDLIDSGVPKEEIIRIGSRSRSEELEACSLKGRVEHSGKKRYEYAMLKKEFEEKMVKLKVMNESIAAKNITRSNDYWSWLKRKYPDFISEMEKIYYDYYSTDSRINNIEEDIKKLIGSAQDVYNKIWLPKKDFEHYLPDQENAIWTFKREVMHSKFVREYREHNLKKLPEALQQFTEILKEKQEIEDYSSREALLSASIVGITTSGCAKYQNLLNSIKPKVVICEEAGEVMESHILASLNADTLQLIMIGDHLQLRPKIDNYFLSSESNRGYFLDISLFERLINKFEEQFDKKTIEERGCLVTLQTQRRMRPIISSLIRDTLYPTLLDHQCVTEYPKLLGFSEPLLFIDHNIGERTDQMGISSYSNPFEVEYVTGLVRYLVRQGYTEKGDIAVLTPYLGQLLAIRHKMEQEKMVVYLSEKDLEEIGAIDEEGEVEVANQNVQTNSTSLKQHIRLSTVDNFQGEEAKVVIISSVRCNAKGKIGFLKSNNRVNVMLSRAKHGMILLGSSSTILQNSKDTLFAKVILMMKEKGLVSSQLHLPCQNHNRITVINSPNGFRKVVDGGCDKECNSRLDCGHLCVRKCHADDNKHRGYACKEPCPKRCKYGHLCQKMCSETCLCTTSVKVSLPCGHTKDIQCHQQSEPIVCFQIIPVKSYCNHSLKVTCDEFHNEKYKEILCKEVCKKEKECGHICNEECGKCFFHSTNPKKSTVEIICKEAPKHPMGCGHPCTGPCGHSIKECPDCTLKCSTECVHSKCPLQCNEACSICAMECAWKCTNDHENKKQCKRVCGSPCDRLPCDLRCEKKLKCGHQCPSICGEICPTKENGCPQCASEDVKNRNICMLDIDLTLGNLNADEQQIIQLPCGHVFTVETLDHLFKLDQLFYVRNEKTSEWERCRQMKTSQEISEEINAICPTCKGRIFNVFRYGRALSAITESHVKRKLFLECLSLAKSFKKEREMIEEMKSDLVKSVKSKVILKKIHENILRLIDKDPTKKIQDLDRAPNLDLDSDLPRRKKLQFSQPLVMIMIEFLKMITIYFTHTRVSKREEIWEKAAFGVGLIACIKCKSSKLLSKYEEVKPLVLHLIGQSRYFKVDDLKLKFARLKDEDFEKINSIEEMKMVYQAMQKEFTTEYQEYGGHWKECPNGHIYTIGDCGGAMEESKCPDCGAVIGGNHHRLRDGNQIASSFLSKVKQ